MSVNYSIRDNGSDMTGNDTGDDNGIFIHSPPVTVVLCILYSVVFVLAVIGNCLVIGVVYKNSCMHTVTNFLLVNLAVADILVSIFCLPTTLIMNILSSYPFGSFLCKVSPFLQGVVVSASVNTLAVIALDRYLAICQHLPSLRRISRKASRVIITVIWLTSLAVMVPWILYFNLHQLVKPNGQVIYHCYEKWPLPHQKREYFLGVTVLVCYAIPAFIITTCYTMIGIRICHRAAPGVSVRNNVIESSKLNVLKMSLTVEMLFIFMWLPLYIITTIYYYNDEPWVFVVVPYVQWLGLSSCCANPLVYCMYSKRYRQAFRRFFVIACKVNARPLAMARTSNHAKLCTELSTSDQQKFLPKTWRRRGEGFPRTYKDSTGRPSPYSPSSTELTLMVTHQRKQYLRKSLRDVEDDPI